MATFGGTTIVGADTNVAFAVDKKSGSRYNLPESGTITGVTIYFQGTHSTHVGGSAQALIYNASSGEPNALVVTSAETSVPDNVDAWLEFSVSPGVVLSSGDYYLCCFAGTTFSSRGFSGQGVNRLNDDVYIGGATDPFGAPSSSTVRKSIYATYSPIAASSSSMQVFGDEGLVC